MTRITSAVLREDTILRLGGDGDNWHMSWAADDSQVIALCDGLGMPGTTPAPYNTALFRMFGAPPDLRFEEISGFPALVDAPLEQSFNGSDRGRYYGFGTLAADGAVYQFLSTFAPGVPAFGGVKLVYSLDDGATWRNQDGSTPVIWQSTAEQSADTMTFWDEPDHAFSLLAVLQMGKGYSANTDGFAYVYAPNGITEGTANHLVLFRVPVTQIPDRAAYEYFAGLDDAGAPTWSSDIHDRRPVCSFVPGWTPAPSAYSWQPSVTYNAPLGLYLMANWAIASEGEDMFTGPSYLGMWSAPTPWGPWEQFHENSVWAPGGDLGARCYQPQIAPKWIADDGLSFWLVWTD